MLTSLHVKNLILVEEITINFERGLTIVTGETGSGKSIIINSINFLFSKNAALKYIIRPNKESATIIAGFKISPKIADILLESEIEVTEEISLKKVIDKTGKTKCFVNSELVSQKILSQLGEALVEVHGQKDTGGLLEEKSHKNILDDFCNKPELFLNLKQSYNNYTLAKKEIEQLFSVKNLGDNNFEDLSNTLKELKKLNIAKGDFEILLEKRINLRNLSSSKDNIEKAFGVIQSKNLLGSINDANKLLSKVSGNKIIDDILKLLESSYENISEINNLFDKLKMQFTNDESLEEIEEKLYKIGELARKNKTIPEELFLIKDKIEEKFNFLEGLDKTIELKKKQLNDLKQIYLNIAKQVLEIRKTCAQKLENIVNANLHYLKMDKSLFKIDFLEVEEEKFNETGIEKIEFLIKTNNLSDFGKINKIASGGELSRIMLSLKLALKETKNVDLMIFDEIDTGISGAVSDVVGKKLKDLSKSIKQVICITHQPQIACYANSHLLVVKHHLNDTTETKVEILQKDERITELARMLAGSIITKEAIANAKILSDLGKSYEENT